MNSITKILLYNTGRERQWQITIYQSSFPHNLAFHKGLTEPWPVDHHLDSTYMCKSSIIPTFMSFYKEIPDPGPTPCTTTTNFIHITAVICKKLYSNNPCPWGTVPPADMRAAAAGADEVPVFKWTQTDIRVEDEKVLRFTISCSTPSCVNSFSVQTQDLSTSCRHPFFSLTVSIMHCMSWCATWIMQISGGLSKCHSIHQCIPAEYSITYVLWGLVVVGKIAIWILNGKKNKNDKRCGQLMEFAAQVNVFLLSLWMHWSDGVHFESAE